MGAKHVFCGAAVIILLLGSFTCIQAQQPQIPTLQVCNPTQVEGKGTVTIESRKDAAHSGSFTVTIAAKCVPPGYPSLSTLIIDVDMSDSLFKGAIIGTTIDQVTSTGKHSPTVYLSGRCKSEKMIGGRYWLMISDNRKGERGTPDVIGFLVLDGKGNRVAYGTGPVIKGDILVAPSPY